MSAEETQEILGISLIDDQLRIVEGRRNSDEFHITQLAHGRTRQPFTFEALADKNTPRLFAEDISRLYETQKFKVNKVAFSLDSRMVLIKKLPVDSTFAGDKIGNQIQWEVEQFAISPVSEYVVDYESLHSNGTYNDMLVVVVRKKIVEFIRRVFKNTNLSLKVVDVDIFSAQRALQINYNYDNVEKVGLIDVEERKIHFSILKEAKYFFSKDVQLPSGDGDENRPESTTRLISKELRRLVLDHQLGKTVEDLNEIFLYGEAVEDAVLENLQNTYDVRIERADPFRKIKLMQKAKQDLAEGRTEPYMISVGAALRGIE
ncbi:MAG: type IV pilus biogenesis protein PilM [bacterium]